MIEAVLFDFDGVLIDSERAIFLAVNTYLKSLGITGATRADVKYFTGAGEDFYFDSIRASWDLKEPREKIINTVLQNFMKELKGLSFFPGLIELIQFLKSHNIKLAVVTSASKDLTDRKIEQTKLDFTIFDLMVYGESVEENKPAPDIYMFAGNQLSVNMANCLVIEDARNGVIAGKNSGAKVMGYSSTLEEEELIAAGADLACSNYSDLLKMDDFLSMIALPTF